MAKQEDVDDLKELIEKSGIKLTTKAALHIMKLSEMLQELATATIEQAKDANSGEYNASELALQTSRNIISTAIKVFKYMEKEEK